MSTWAWCAVMALVMLGARASGQEPAEALAKPRSLLQAIYAADPATFDPKQFAAASEGNEQVALPGFGLVRDSRKVFLNKGDNIVRITDVASGIDPTTVSFTSRTAPGSTSVLEQDYQFDLVGSEKVLKKYLGQSIIVEQRTQRLFQGTLLSARAGECSCCGPNLQGTAKVIPRSRDRTCRGSRSGSCPMDSSPSPRSSGRSTLTRPGPRRRGLLSGRAA